MLNTSNVEEFIKNNDSELRQMVSYICGRYNVSSVDDMVQEVYYRVLSRRIIENFDPNYKVGKSANPKISTYLYTIIDNLVKTSITQESKLPKFICLDDVEMSGNIDDIDLALSYEKVAAGYIHVTEQNDFCNNILRMELNDFEAKYLSGKANKKYTLHNSHGYRDKNHGCSMRDIYRYMNNGLSNVEIALIIGVSPMYVTMMKRDIKKALKKYGISWNPIVRRSRQRNGKNKVSKM